MTVVMIIFPIFVVVVYNKKDFNQVKSLKLKNIKLNVHDEIRFMEKQDISNLKLFEEDYQLLNKLDDI